MLDPPPVRDDPASAQLRPRVILLDFDSTEIEEASKDRWPRNPIKKWWTGFDTRLAKWCPRWWRLDLPERRRWLLKQFGGSSTYQMAKDMGDPERLTAADEMYLDIWSHS
ncbi:uncharacterized protein B0I36DRAFT_23894 [Microdochium trichocladiopsis]|uniref:Uncharacterized protein n=1 Tax=Microdochium trichocladiopsis TaxID=1682393 RepID=A0A9P8YL21_9PEZI|nr:uncharacterized protein B0I36DRAFT_23894 [Microdochium trichocladiopsis]KAH7041491.1 hypothetical protein B0I36DRAFT_23894 [Microdochium trichocladiopsis]